MLIIIYQVIVALCVFVNNTASMYSSKAMEGYPSGYLSDCPGSTIPQPISPTSLKALTISVPRIYNYYEMKTLAKDPNIDFSKPTMMFLGGYLQPTARPLPLTSIIKKTYKKLGYNVMLLDTFAFTTFPYPLAAAKMRTIGKHVAEMLANLTNYGLKPKKLELLGISLGAQTMSFIAKNYRLITGMNISRITALDPAGPCFRNLGPEDRLDQTDADFVDVINTNIDGFGMAAPVGHVNFYVNGGEYQPGDILWVPCSVFCSHARSFTLWIAAIQHPNSFIAMKCDSVQEARNKNCYDKNPIITNTVGLKIEKNVQGIFYLPTRNNYPYFLGLKGLKKKNEFFNSKLKLDKNSQFISWIF